MGLVDECEVALTARRRSLEINAEMHATLVKQAQSPFAMKKKGSVEQLKRQTRPVRTMDAVTESAHQHAIAAAERDEDEENAEFDRNMPTIARKPRRASLPAVDEPGRPSLPQILPPKLVDSDVPPPPPGAQSPPPPPPSQDIEVDELNCFTLRSEGSSASLSIPRENSGMDEDGLRLLNQGRRDSTNSIDGKTLAKRSERRASMPASTQTLYINEPASPRPRRQSVQPPAMFAHPAPRRLSVDLGNLRTENGQCLCSSQGKCFACVGARRGSGTRSPRVCTCGNGGWCVVCAARRNSMPARWSKLSIANMPDDQDDDEAVRTARRASIQMVMDIQPELEKRVRSPFVLKRLGSVESVKRHRVSVSSSVSGISRTNSEEDDVMRVLPSPRNRKPRRASMHALTEVPVGACSPVCTHAILA